jgi:RND family efflux transporter MFP subunit
MQQATGQIFWGSRAKGLLGVAVLAVVACSKPEAPPEPVRAVKVVTVAPAALRSGYEFAGEVRARTESRLGFRVGGKLLTRAVEVGQAVKAGQVLARLDPQDLQLAAQAANAQVAAARTNRDLAAADLQRFEALKQQNFISPAELDRRSTALQAAQAQLEQAQAQASAQANQTRYGDLVADAPGVVTAVLAEPGQVLAAGTPVVQVALDGPRDAVFAVPEDKLALIQPGGAVQVRAWGQTAVVAAKVREVAASADAVTRTFAVKVALPATSQWPLGSTLTLWPAAMQPQGQQIIKLPTSALRQEGQGTAVWVLDTASMTVKLQPIRVATADGNEVVVAEGLLPGQQVVVAGVHVLAPGQKVTIYKEKQPQPLASAAQTAPVSVADAVSAPARAAQ